MNDLLENFTAYIESLCIKHKDINHSTELRGKRHFVELSTDQTMQQLKNLYYPLVTLDKLTITYAWQPDNRRKSRYLEMMFVDIVPDAGDFARIQEVKNKMERIAEEFMLKIDADKRDRKTYPFLRSLVMDNIELNYIENKHINLYGVLLSARIELPFPGCLEDGTFI